MSEIMAQLREDHKNVAGMLDVLEQHLDRVHDAGPADFELMHNIMVYMTEYPDQMHHPLEDFVFEQACTKSADLEDIVATLEREHVGLAEKGKRFRDMLDRVVDGAMVLRTELEDTGRDYVAFLRHHMELEDKDAFPLVVELLDESDWQWIAEKFHMRKDPVFGPIVVEQFVALYEYIQGEID